MALKQKNAGELLEIYKQEKIASEMLQEKIIESKKDYLPHIPEKEQQLRKRLETVLNHFLPEYAKADLLADKYQNYYKNASKAIYILAAFAVIIISGQFIFDLNHWVGSGEIIAIVCILLIITVGNKIGWHRRWVDYRFLAERLRGGIFMVLLSEKQPSGDEYGFPFQWTGSSWIMNYYKNLWQDHLYFGKFTAGDIPALKDFLQAAWLEDQRKYHAAKKGEQLEKHEKISRCGEIFFWLTFIAACFHFLPHLLHLAHIQVGFLSHDTYNRIFTFFAIAFPVIASACSAMRAHFDYKKIADRSEMMEKNLDNLKDRLNQVSDMQSLHLVTRDTESLMIQENADWYVTIGVHILEPA